ncbi:response regulator transcription factor [Streptomyces sp. NPDC056835]|uniref:helix-turn-helix transcriptional regulator n=1 Tax=Streptomyces sp. NPDC056835 TaxID=3345956 RepID=UPI0036A33631
MPLEQPEPHGEESEQLTMVVVLGGNLFSRIEAVSVIGHEEGFDAVGYAADPSCVHRIVAERRPGVVAVLEDADAESILQELATSTPRPRVVVVSLSQKRADSGTSRASVGGMPVNRINRESLIPAIRLIRSGWRVRAGYGERGEAGPVKRQADPWRRLHQLTAREAEVAELMLRGWSNVEIAEGLELSGATVKSHVHSLMGKLNLKNRIDVITTAYRAGLARPREARPPLPPPHRRQHDLTPVSSPK